MKRILKVTGKGKLILSPDLIIINLNLSQVHSTYESALENASSSLNLIKNALVSLGFKDKDLKTSHFSIKAEYESRRNLEGGFITTLVGYRYNQNLNFKIDIDNELLGKVLYTIGQTNVNPKMEISYSIKDIETCKNDLLEKAIVDARNKACIISRASSLILGKILSIDYSFNEEKFASHVMDMDVARFTANQENLGCNINLTPDDIEVSDVVNITYVIK